ncbi:MAG: T9SS type A sorting domain-containing protein [Chitinophagales bacterium]|nr:T9SS type A sorting domain-containing protein [Chitinophagales bacterium]
MKQTIFIFLLVMCAGMMQAQTVTLTGNITTARALSKDTIYILEGFVYIKDGGSLFIPGGTIVKGDKATKGSLICTRDGILAVNGTSTEPVIFTSSEPEGSRAAGDWGGIIFCGNAPINAADINGTDAGNQAVIEGGVDNPEGDGQYGGTDENDSRGGMTYVRIEYPGIPFLPGSEINGLTLGGVGAGTILEHIQVSYSGDDAFEFFGGTVNAKWLVAHATLDDDFDTDFGYSGNIQFAVSYRDPDYADISGSNGSESDNDGTGSEATPYTNGVISNATIIGPIQNPGDVINANYKRAANFKKNTKLNIHNSVLVGFPSGIMIDGSGAEANADAETLEVRNTFLAGNTKNFELAVGSTFDTSGWFNTPAYENTILTASGDVMLGDPYNNADPDFRPTAASPLLGAASFTDDDVSSGFTIVTYAGAFSGTDDWTGCWVNWDPQNTDYSTPGAATTIGSAASFTITVDTNTLVVTFTNTSSNADEYFWNFDDVLFGGGMDTSSAENPSWDYSMAGTYEITLIAYGCTNDTIVQSITFDSTGVSINTLNYIDQIKVYPNPAKDVANISINATQAFEAIITMVDITGRVVSEILTVQVTEGKNELRLDVSSLSEGMYFISMDAGMERKIVKVLVSH